MDIDYSTKPNLTELEASVLTEYQNINATLIKLNRGLKSLTNKDDVDGGESIRLVETLRQMETKLLLIYTFFRGAVYTLYADVGEGVADGEDEEEQEEAEAADILGSQGEFQNDDDQDDSRYEGRDDYDKGTNELLSISDT